MKRLSFFFLAILLAECLLAQRSLKARRVLNDVELANRYFMEAHPEPGDSIRTHKIYPSNIWTRSVYFEGLMALYHVSPRADYLDYAVQWADANLWGLYGGYHTRNADNLCCAQTYIDLYRLGICKGQEDKKDVLGDVTRAVNYIVASVGRDDWWWVDALQMAMPVFARMGVEKKDMRYFKAMMELYYNTRNKIARIGLFNEMEGLWWRDNHYIPPYKEPNGQNCYWSRGNGWAYAALVRTMDELDQSMDLFSDEDKASLERYYQRLKSDFLKMSLSIKDCQREDGFWNRSLLDSCHYGGKETTGTALFVYGMSWGIRHKLLSPKVYYPVVEKGWNGLASEALHEDGFIGYVQGTGKEPKDGHPVGFDTRPDFDDFGVGCFLLAGTEVYRLLQDGK